MLTQYFPPETGAPQNRLYDLAARLAKGGNKVTVLTAMPNYPAYEIQEAWRGKWYTKEEDPASFVIHRAWIFVSKNKSVVFRLLNYFSFVFTALVVGLFKIGKADVILCESPPLFLGMTAVCLKKGKRAKLAFNVSDLWPESAVKLGLVQNRFIIWFCTKLEEWIYRHSDFISGQTQGIVGDIGKRFPAKPIFWLRNGVDPAELQGRLTGMDWRARHGFGKEDVLFYFGGLLGYAQGLDCIIQAAALVRGLPEAKFVIIGDGPEKERLLELKEALNVENVLFFDGVPKNQIADIIQSIDVGIIPLKRIDLFKGAIPSKIFEILCLKKPVLLGIEGEAKELFIEQANAGLAFVPEDAEDLAQKIRYVLKHRKQIAVLGENGSRFVVTHFNRNVIADEFYDFIKS